MKRTPDVPSLRELIDRQRPKHDALCVVSLVLSVITLGLVISVHMEVH